MNPIAGFLEERRCLATVDGRLAQERAASLQRAAADRERAREACLTRLARIRSLTADLRRAEGELAALRAEDYPGMAPPPPLDEERLRRLTREDQDLVRERYEQRRDAWQQAEGQRRADWWHTHSARLASTQRRLDDRARQLRQLEPRYFTGPASIEVDGAVARALAACPPPATAAAPVTPRSVP